YRERCNLSARQEWSFTLPWRVIDRGTLLVEGRHSDPLRPCGRKGCVSCLFAEVARCKSLESLGSLSSQLSLSFQKDIEIGCGIPVLYPPATVEINYSSPSRADGYNVSVFRTP